jgi:hypothetical protein
VFRVLVDVDAEEFLEFLWTDDRLQVSGNLGKGRVDITSTIT